MCARRVAPVCRTARIVNVSSAAHQFGHIRFEDPDFMASGSYDRWKAYGQSKLANCLFTYELARRLPANSNITVNTLHPGLVRTQCQSLCLGSPAVPACLPAARQQQPLHQLSAVLQ